MTPASPITFGISPESEPITGTSHAIASMITRPNCSFQFERVSDGTTSMSILLRTSGTSRDGTELRKKMRSRMPSRAACTSNSVR